MAECSFELNTQMPSAYVVGEGQIQIIQGRLNWPEHTLQAVKLLAPLESAAGIEWNTSSKGDATFRLSIPWRLEDVGQTQSIALQVADDQHQHTVVELGQLELIESNSAQVRPGRKIGDEPLIAICMASYQPNISRLMRQIESIICQHYQNWVLIISDDASDSSTHQQIKVLCKLDPRRIRLIENTDRVGFYHNFERALVAVPSSAQMVALADQDDVWYPEKLQRLADRLNAEDAPTLVYSDMHIVDENGGLIANSFWGKRKNEYRDFDSLLLNNTITGAATLFKCDLLAALLPFPEKLGDMFHDHWLACVAASMGKLAYIDAPLYDYYQYQHSVIGHRVHPLADEAPRSAVRNANEPTSDDKWARREQGYIDDCLRLQLIADTLKLRFPGLAKKPYLNLMNGGYWSMIKLFKVYLKGLLLGRTRGGAELALMMGFLARERQKRRE